MGIDDDLNAAAHDDDLSWWAATGLMALTGPAESPLGPPEGFRARLTAVTDRIANASAQVGTRVELDGASILTERAAISGFRRGGRISCGGATRLLDADGWFALSLARESDIELLPALLEQDAVDGADWDAIERRARALGAAAFVERARMLGLPAAVLSETQQRAVPTPEPITIPARAPHRPLRVVDLSSLWAGPLCASVLALAGADVVKTESVARPDGGRAGPAAFFDVLNGGKSSVSFDHRTPAGRAPLVQLIQNADVVIDAARPRVFEQWGIDRRAFIAEGAPRVWLSITAYGPDRDWIGFGDDAAVAGGLVAHDVDGPYFCADAIADPLTGLVAAAAALEALARHQACVIDVALADVAAHFAGPTLVAARGSGPKTRRLANGFGTRTPAAAPALGADDDAVWRRWGLA